MSIVLVSMVSAMYALAAIDEAYRQNYPTALMLVGYVAANVGLVWGMIR